MTIATLIDKVDTVEAVQLKIVEILVAEVAAQKALATTAGEDPRLWELRVFMDRSNPWAEFVDVPDELDAAPIVNVSIDSQNFDRSASDIVERQKSNTTYNLDCFGYGVSASDGAGHKPGDVQASAALKRAMRLVRNILMAGEHTYLDLRGTVWRRWVSSIQVFQPAIGDRPIQQIVGARIALDVEFSEFSPQVQGDVLEEIGTTVYRGETGEVYLRADYDYSEE